MDVSFLKAFELDVGDGIDRGEADPGPKAIVPVLFAQPYDGEKKRFQHFGEAVLAMDEGRWGISFGANQDGFARFLQAMKEFKLHDHVFWRHAFRSAAAVWRREELTEAGEAHVFFFIDPEARRVMFFEHPGIVLLFDTLDKTARFLRGGSDQDLKIELVDD